MTYYANTQYHKRINTLPYLYKKSFRLDDVGKFSFSNSVVNEWNAVALSEEIIQSKIIIQWHAACRFKKRSIIIWNSSGDLL